MTYDPDIQLLMANARIAQAQAEAASERQARTAGHSNRSERARPGRGSSGSGGSFVFLVLSPVRRLATVATAVVSRHHPAGKAL